MPIVERTANQLVIHHSQFSFKRLLWQVVVIALGVGLLLWSGPAKLDCQRSQPNQVTCQLSKPGWLGLARWRQRAIRNLQGVTLNRYVDDGVFYQVILRTSDGDLPLRPYQTSGLDNTRKTVVQIERFLNDPTANRLSVAQVDWVQWFVLLPGVCMLLGGGKSLHNTLFNIRTKAIESYRFDQEQNQVIYQYGGLFRQRQQHYPFSTIQRLILDLDQSAAAWLLLELRSGDLLCLNRRANQLERQTFRGSNWQELQPLADEMSRLLRRPWQLTVGFSSKWLQAQVLRHKRASGIARFFGISLEPPTIWIFDRSSRTILQQKGQAITTYPLKQITDVQVTPVGEPLQKQDSDGSTYYEANYQLSLVLSTEKRLVVQAFSSHEYNWHPHHIRGTAA